MKGSSLKLNHKLSYCKDENCVVHTILDNMSECPEYENGICCVATAKNGYMSYADIAGVFGVSRQRVKQIETIALRKLRHPARLSKLIEACNEIGIRRTV